LFEQLRWASASDLIARVENIKTTWEIVRADALLFGGRRGTESEQQISAF